MLPGWEICYPGDIDQYSIELEQHDKLVVIVDFSHAAGDLEAALVNPDGLIIDYSRSETDDEEVSISSALNKGTYTLAVWGYGDAVNKYILDITITSAQ